MTGWRAAHRGVDEQAVVPAASAISIPDGIDTRVAAAVMLQGITAHYLCHSTYPVALIDTVVVHASAGGVGLLLTQMVKVAAASSSRPPPAQPSPTWPGRPGPTTSPGTGSSLGGEGGDRGDRGGRGLDGVGQATFDASLAAVRPRGMMVLYGGSEGRRPVRAPAPRRGRLTVHHPPTMIHYIASREELVWRTGDLFTWISERAALVRIGGTYPLAEAARAHDDLAARRTTGKLLLLPS